MNGVQSSELKRGRGRGYGIVDLRKLKLLPTIKSRKDEHKTKTIWPVGGRGIMHNRKDAPTIPTILVQNGIIDVKRSEKRGRGRGEILKTNAETSTKRNMEE